MKHILVFFFFMKLRDDSLVSFAIRFNLKLYKILPAHFPVPETV